MKKITVILFCIISILGMTSSNSESTGLSKGTVGPMVVGQHVFKFASIDMNATVKRKLSEEEFYLEYTFKLREGVSIKALLSDDDVTIEKLSTNSDSFSTSRNAKVGMTLSELKFLYPNGSFDRHWDSMGSYFSFILPEYEGVFEIDASNVVGDCGHDMNKCETLMKDLKSVRFFTF